MSKKNWVNEFPGSITVTDKSGIIVEMNAVACKTFQKYGGSELIGKDLVAVHPEPAQAKVKALLETKATKAYTIEKNGIHKLVYQTPWYENGEYAGYVEFSLEIPANMPHYKRTP